MTDKQNFEKGINVLSKQIIIDGVDVSECDYLIKESIYDYCNGEYLTLIGKCTCSDNEMCEYNPQCSYKKVLKQLKAKEQECEELKENLPTAITRLMGEIDQLKAENERLKNAVMQKCPQCGEVYLDPMGAKLYETLTEIKEIVKEQLPTVNYNFAKSMHPEMFNCYEQILQKISKCEV